MSINVYAAEYKDVTEVYSKMCIVQCPKYLNIRSSASTSSRVVGLIRTGGVCELVAEGENWCAIKSGNITGYVLKEYLLLGDLAVEKAKEIATPRVRFITSGVVYAGADLESKEWLHPVPGTSYDILEEEDNWLKVDIMGAVGYVPVDDTVICYYGLDTATPTYDLSNVVGVRKDIITYAMSFLGNRYVWGGNDPHTGADCSGFVRYVYNNKRPDIYLPRCSYDQCYVGKDVNSLDMRPGDLIFYANSQGTVHHVAMYIGNGTIVHAANSRSGIILSAWNYQAPRYIKNILGD